jgi:aconitate decarboxylase
MVAPPVLSELFATHALDTRFSDLTPDAVEQAKIFIADTLAVGVSGSSAYGADVLAHHAVQWGPGSEAGIWGTSQRATAGNAAMVNAYQIHCQEYDCVHEGAVLHPMATLLPAALAYAEREGGVSGEELIVACAVGVNVSAGLGIASRSGLTFFRPATAGGFGAVAAVGRLMRLSHEQLVSAFGLQYAATSGTLQPHIEGSASLPLQVALNSRAALQACELALSGFPGARDVFEGPYGYLRLFEGPEAWDLTETLRAVRGQRWLISELSHKPFPAGRATHGGIEGIQTLMRQGRGDAPLSASDVDAVTITASPVCVRLCSRPDLPGPSPNYARLCMSFIGAKVLQHGSIDLSHYRDEELTRPETHELARRIVMVSDGQADPNALVPVSVELRLTDGEVRSWSCAQMLASPARRLSKEQHLAKFDRCLSFSVEDLGDNEAQLVARCDRLEEVEDVRVVTQRVCRKSL